MGPDDIDILVRQYYEDSIDYVDFRAALCEVPQQQLAEHFIDILDRKEEAMRFALTATYGYEDQVYSGSII